MSHSLYRKLFKLNSNGKSIQTWEIHVADDSTSYLTVSGKVDGKMQVSAPHVVTAKVNRSQREQVLLEMNSKISLQYRKKYVDDIKDVASAEGNLPGYTPMTAKKWKDQYKKIEFPCLVQPKLDGMRCLVTKDGMFSRGRKPIESCQHVFEALKPFFKEWPDARLDGELYAHEFSDDFEMMMKAVKKSAKHTKPEDLALQAKVRYHVYDVPQIGDYDQSDSFADRLYFVADELLVLTRCSESLEIVKTYPCISEEALFGWHTQFLEEGYEGTMVRNTDSPYKAGRSDDLLKLKDFIEDEFLITEVLEGKGGLVGHAGKFALVTKEGNTFSAKLEGSHKRLKWVWNNPEEVIGKMCTVKFFGYTNKNNVPRIGVAKAVRGLPDRSDWL